MANNIVGPGTDLNQNADTKPLLEGATEYEVITILNPLTDDFQVRVAQDVPVNTPMEIRGKTGLVQTERDITQAYGLDLKNPEHKALKYVYNDTIIPAGQMMKFRGDQAQVVVKQLVNEIMQREKNSLKMADPWARNEVEQRIIKSRGSIQDLMDNQFQTPQQQINDAITKSNEVSDEPFPGLDIGEPVTKPKRSPGRPAKASTT